MSFRFQYILVAILVTAVVVGCSNSSTKDVPETVSVKLTRGTEIQLMLLEKLDSGGTEVGRKVPLVICQNVTDPTGRIVIPMGTTVDGEITQSRAAGALSAMMNQPARLQMKVAPIALKNSQGIEISGNLDDESTTEFSFSKDKISFGESRAALESSFEDKAKLDALTAISLAIDGSKSISELKEKLGDDEKLKELLQHLGYEETGRLMQDRKTASEGIERISGVLEKLRKGDVSALYGGESTIVLAAIEELGGLASEVGDRLKGIFKGRNIRPAIGSRITVFVAKDTNLSVPVRSNQ